MAGPKKNLAGLAIELGPMGKRGPPPGDAGDMPPDGGAGGTVENAMTDFLEGVKADDPKAMADAFLAAMDASQ